MTAFWARFKYICATESNYFLIGIIMAAFSLILLTAKVSVMWGAILCLPLVFSLFALCAGCSLGFKNLLKNEQLRGSGLMTLLGALYVLLLFVTSF